MEDSGDFDSFIVPDTSRKRKSVLPINKTSVSEYGSVTLDEIDDIESTDLSQEKTKKRRSALLNIIKERSERKPLREEGERAFLTEDQMRDQYEYAMKLHMGNKINDKNVFSLNLNLASCIFQRYQSADKINFQKAAVDIEAGTRIWSYKVDAMHKDTTQAVRDLIESKAQLDMSADEEDAPGEDVGKNAKLRRKKKLGEVTFDDPAKITDKKLTEMKNPYQQIRAAKLDSATDISEFKLSISNLCITSGGVRPNENGDVLQVLREDSNTSTHSSPEKDSKRGKWIDESIFAHWEKLSKELTTVKDIAPNFNKKAINEQLTSPVPDKKTLTNKAPIEMTPTYTFEDTSDVRDDFPEGAIFENDDAGVPLPPSLVDNEMDIKSTMGEQVHGSIFGDRSDVFSMVSSSLTNTGDYDITDMITLTSDAHKFLESVFDTSMKFRKPRLPPRIKLLNEAAGDVTQKAAAPKRKRLRLIDRVNESIDLDADWNDEILYTEIRRSGRKKKETDVSKFLLPEADLVDTITNTSSTFMYWLRDFRYKCTGFRFAEDKPNNVEHPIEDQANPNDYPVSDQEDVFDNAFEHTANPAALFEDNDNPKYENPFPEATEDPTQDTPEHNMNELPQPEVGSDDLLKVKQIEKIKINFDRRARRVNIRLVKNEMWTIIQDAREKSILSEVDVEEAGDSQVIPSSSFKDLQEELQEKLEGENKENLTPAMALVCVLYLANEKNLDLQQTNSTDFIIKAPII